MFISRMCIKHICFYKVASSSCEWLLTLQHISTCPVTLCSSLTFSLYHHEWFNWIIRNKNSTHNMNASSFLLSERLSHRGVVSLHWPQPRVLFQSDRLSVIFLFFPSIISLKMATPSFPFHDICSCLRLTALSRSLLAFNRGTVTAPPNELCFACSPNVWPHFLFPSSRPVSFFLQKRLLTVFLTTTQIWSNERAQYNVCFILS